MIKRLIQRLIHRLYVIGKFEQHRRDSEERNRSVIAAATIGESVWLDEESSIVNQQADSTKIKIGRRSRIMGQLLVNSNGGCISIGEDCFLGPHSRIWSWVGITIGHRVLISHNVNIHDSISHPLDSGERHTDFVHFAKTGKQLPFDLRVAGITIADDVWIGFNATIMKGVNIGKGAIIGANTVVLHDVPPFAVVVGNPARIIKYSS